MPRNQNAGNPSLRNRNRVTNKTRLKVIKGNIDADPFAIDEDEERARVISTAGVDAEDANEHHLQAVLSAASHRATKLLQKAVNGAASQKETKQNETSGAAYIPVPDAAGVVEHYEELYPAGRWKQPIGYVKFSNTIDECMPAALVDGFTYVMDERDAEWLDKMNQEARGEGTSSQTAANGGTSTRGNLHRSAKAKGKEAEASTPIAMSEDDFELVMGLFEKVTHDNTPFLHVSFQQHQGSCIPAFSEYNDVFANELSASHFAGFIRPSGLPPPQTLLKMARAVYPHWRERKSEREGARIIPILNFDESDAKNESYICFRRREIKAIRKTRTAQVSSADKLLRLKGELGHAFQLAQNVYNREMLKREACKEAYEVWEKRVALLEAKRQNPSLQANDDEDLLFDKERVVKKPKIDLRVNKTNRQSGEISASPTPAEPLLRPQDKYAEITASIEVFVKRNKDADHGWEDQTDTPYQQRPIPFSDRYFKSVRSIQADENLRDARCMRLRRGRGGSWVDRHSSVRLRLGGSDAMKTKLTKEKALLKRYEDDQMERLAERWRYDTPDNIGADDEDRVLLDDFDPRNIRYQAKFLFDQEPIMTDPRLYLYDAQNGTHSFVSPLKLAVTPRRDTTLRPTQAPSQAAQPVATQQQVVPPAQPVNATSTPTPSPNKIQPTAVPQHTRTPSNCIQRPSSSASAHSVQGAAGQGSPQVAHSSVAQAVVPPAQKSPTTHAPIPLVNGPAANGATVTAAIGTTGTLNGMANFQSQPNTALLTQQAYIIQMQKQQNMKLYAAQMANAQRNGQAYAQQHVLNGMNGMGVMNGMNGATTDANANQANMNFNNPVAMNLKLPTQRQVQWTNAARTQIMGNGDAAAMQFANLMQAQNAQAVNAHLSPARNAHSPPNMHGQDRMSPQQQALLAHHQLSLSPHVGNAQTQAQQHTNASPVRNIQTPVPPSPSPLLSHQMPGLVGSMPTQGQGF